MRLDLFNKKEAFCREASFFKLACWNIFSWIFFTTNFPWPSDLKTIFLRAFGAKLGKGVFFQPSVTIHFPWKLRLGNYVWIGRNTFLHNMETIEIGNHTAIAHNVFITSGSHDFNKVTFPYKNRAVTIGSSVWVSSCSFIGPGVFVSDGTVVFPGSVVTKTFKPFSIIAGNPAKFLKFRKLKR